MDLSIEKSNAFQNEYKQFSTSIELVENVELKKELNKLLLELLNLVRSLDSQHVGTASSIRSNIAGAVIDQRSKLAETRKRLAKRLESYKKTVKS
tara:strand:- start:1936 stop:2220 length:285 start_codon:yes stop_codon:yes gene_type:complete